MSVTRWVWVLLGCLGACCSVSAGEGVPASPSAAPPTQATRFYPLPASGGTARVEADVTGVVLQEVRLLVLRSVGDIRDYRLSLLLRNAAQTPATPMFRVVLWSQKKPEAAFDVRGQERHLSLQPRTSMRFVGDLELNRKVQLSRFTLVPLPPEEVVMRADRPLPISPMPPEQLLQPTDGPAAAGEKPGKEGEKPGEGTQQLDPERVRQLELALAHYRTLAQQMYLQQVTIPEVNGVGTLAGVGPYGPIYQVGGGGAGLNSLYVQSPSGWSPLQAMPMMMNPMSVWVDPFQQGGGGR